jgi:tetratricopeptide (TPR) repeat protein
MDGRLTLWLAAALVTGLAGCTHNNLVNGPTLPEAADSSPTNKNIVQSRPPEGETKESPKHFKPGTLVAMGALREQMANEVAKTPEEKARLLEEARQAYFRALVLDPKCLPAIVGLARHWDKLDMVDNSLYCYDAALKLAPYDASVWFEVGMMLARRKQWEPALARLRKAGEIEPTNRRYVSSYALALARANRPDECLVWLKKVQGEGEAHCTLARALHDMRQDDLAREHAERALAIDPSLDAAQDLLADLGVLPASATGDDPGSPR